MGVEGQVEMGEGGVEGGVEVQVEMGEGGVEGGRLVYGRVKVSGSNEVEVEMFMEKSVRV